MVKRKTSEGFAKLMSKILKYLVMFVVVYYFAITAYSFGRDVFTTKGVAEEPGMDMTIEVENTTSVREFAKTLEEYGIIREDYVLWAQSYIYGTKTVKAGTYTFNTSQNGEEILATIAAGGQTETETTSAEDAQ